MFLLLCSAFFSACEVAYFSLNPLQLNEMSEKKGRLGRLVNSLLNKPRELLITIYIGNEFVNIAISVVVTSVAITLFGSIGCGHSDWVQYYAPADFRRYHPKEYFN